MTINESVDGFVRFRGRFNLAKDVALLDEDNILGVMMPRDANHFY